LALIPFSSKYPFSIAIIGNENSGTGGTPIVISVCAIAVGAMTESGVWAV
jgi:hypothetical protein